MVGYLKNNILLAIAFVFLGASSSTKFHITFDDYDIHDICDETLHPSFCVKILKSTPLTERSDVVGLEKFLVDNAQKKISYTVSQIQSVVPKIKDPLSKQVHMKCLTHMRWAATYCDNALTAWAGRHKNDFDAALTSIASLAEECENKLQGQINNVLGDLYNVCDTALVLSSRLP